MSKFKFCVGNQNGLRSTVWKVFLGSNKKSDVYIQSRMMGNEMKISLHESGLCQCSLTDNWVKKYRKQNAERHIERWQRQEPTATLATLIFQIIIPETELRQVDTDEKLQKVAWIETPPVGYATKIVCYITPPLDVKNLEDARFPYPLLHYFQLPSGHWFVLLLSQEKMNQENLQALAHAQKIIKQRAGEFGIELKPEFRAGFGMHEAVKDIHSIIEVAPFPRTIINSVKGEKENGE